MNAADNAVGNGKEVTGGGMRIIFSHRGDRKLLPSHVNHDIPKAGNAN